MKGWKFIIVFMAAAGIARGQADIFNPMRDAIRGGDATALSKKLATSVELNLEGDIKTYSKAQSEFVLRDFFKKHPVKEFNIAHTGSSPGGLQFAIGRYASGADNYTVLMRVRQVGSEYLIHEISFVRE